MGKVLGLFAFVGSVTVGLFVTGSLSLLIYTRGYMDGSNGCSSPGLVK